MRRKSTASETCDRKLLLDAVAGLLAYPAEMKNLAARRRMLFSRLSPRHQRIAGSSGYSKRIRDLDRAVTRNTEITASIAKLAEKQFGVTRAELLHSTRPAAHSRVVELLKHFVRDWSDEGERERSVLMPPILDCIRNEFGLRSGKRILVPGAGVGRLAYEISLLGCQTDANEFSSLMHLGNLFALEQTANSCSVFPFVHNFSYQRSSSSQLREITFPDVSPPETDHSSLSVSFGDFLALKSKYDAVATLFFIDTAENVLAYIDTIHRLLAPGGIWVNYGPLKWGSAPRVELTVEELVSILPELGFVVERRWTGDAEYVADSESMWHGHYGLEGWVARRV
ncbi:N2227-like protein-domain-containing protein [Kockiozyma suomiensis]|uniref:N2227-like protein-domain-containing protein n=1 Tax=Kockiozyma suomiensis TaxID=1337062 RepID=UPI003343B3EE